MPQKGLRSHGKLRKEWVYRSFPCDGLSRKTIIVIDATNCLDVIYPALILPGSFNELFLVPIHDKKVSREIIKVRTGKVALAEDVYSEKPVFRPISIQVQTLKLCVKRQEGLPYLIILTQKDIKQMHFLKAIAQTSLSVTSDII